MLRVPQPLRKRLEQIPADRRAPPNERAPIAVNRSGFDPRAAVARGRPRRSPAISPAQYSRTVALSVRGSRRPLWDADFRFGRWLSHNVWEWTADPFTPDHSDLLHPCCAPENGRHPPGDEFPRRVTKAPHISARPTTASATARPRARERPSTRRPATSDSAALPASTRLPGRPCCARSPTHERVLGSWGSRPEGSCRREPTDLLIRLGVTEHSAAGSR